MAEPIVTGGLKLGFPIFSSLNKVHGADTQAGPAVVKAILTGLVIAYVPLRIAWIFIRPLDPDEAQHLHMAWRILVGEIPYLHFWDNHMPLFHVLLGPVVGELGERAEIYFVGRGIALVFSLAILAVFWRLMREWGDGVATLGTCLLAYNDIFIRKTTEVRPDTLAVLFFLIALVLLRSAVPSSSRKKYFLAGFLAGLALLTSLKAIYGILVAAVFLVLRGGFFDFSRRDRLRNCAWFMGAMAVPLSLASLHFLREGALGPWFRQSIVENLVFPDSTHQAFVNERNALLWFAGLLGLAGFVKAGRQAGRQAGSAHRSQPAETILVCTTVFMLIVVSLPTTPAVYLQTILWVIPGTCFLAVLWAADSSEYGARLLGPVEPFPAGSVRAAIIDERHDWLRTIRRVGAGAVIVGMVVIPVSWVVVRTAKDWGNDVLETPRTLLRATRSGDCLFDGTAIAVFRRSPIQYPSLVNGVRQRIRTEERLQKDLLSRLEAARCQYVRKDSRVLDLPPALQQFLGRSYVPAGPEKLYRWERARDQGKEPET